MLTNRKHISHLLNCCKFPLELLQIPSGNFNAILNVPLPNEVHFLLGTEISS